MLNMSVRQGLVSGTSMENEPLRAYKTNTHRENVVFHFLQMKSFAISAHPPVSLVTNNSQI